MFQRATLHIVGVSFGVDYFVARDNFSFAGKVHRITEFPLFDKTTGAKISTTPIKSNLPKRNVVDDIYKEMSNRISEDLDRVLVNQLITDSGMLSLTGGLGTGGGLTIRGDNGGTTSVGENLIVRSGNLFSSMINPLRRYMDYSSIGRQIFMVESLPPAAQPVIKNVLPDNLFPKKLPRYNDE